MGSSKLGPASAGATARQAFLLHVSRSEVDGGASEGEPVAGVDERRHHPVARFFNGGIRKADDDDDGISVPAYARTLRRGGPRVDFHFDSACARKLRRDGPGFAESYAEASRVRLNPVYRCRTNLGQHGGSFD